MMIKVEVAVPNDSQIIKNCEYDRDELGRCKLKWATIITDR
jgi:hypothetical protein